MTTAPVPRDLAELWEARVRSAVGTGSWDLNASATELQTRSPLELDLAAL